jgi:predicted enzyme related to lactoylglutathione lyase
MSAQLGRIIIYTKRTEELVAFYCQHFGFEVLRLEGDRIVELVSQGTGMNILLYPMSTGRKEGQTLVKLVFDVEDVDGFCSNAKERGLLFGSIHRADGYCFANAKDPAKNTVSVSSRAFVER